MAINLNISSEDFQSKCMLLQYHMPFPYFHSLCLECPCLANVSISFQIQLRGCFRDSFPWLLLHLRLSKENESFSFGVLIRLCWNYLWNCLCPMLTLQCQDKNRENSLYSSLHFQWLAAVYLAHGTCWNMFLEKHRLFSESY